MTTNPPRRMGPPGVSSGYFQRTIVGYTGLGLVTDIGLCPVLRTRPGLPPPQIRLPSTFWVRGIPVRRPALLPTASFRRTLLSHRCLRLPFASVRLGLDFARQACQTTGQHHLAAGPRPGTYRDREEPHDSPLPHHAAYGSVLRGSADQGRSDPGEQS